MNFTFLLSFKASPWWPVAAWFAELFLGAIVSYYGWTCFLKPKVWDRFWNYLESKNQAHAIFVYSMQELLEAKYEECHKAAKKQGLGFKDFVLGHTGVSFIQIERLLKTNDNSIVVFMGGSPAQLAKHLNVSEERVLSEADFHRRREPKKVGMKTMKEANQAG